MRTRPTQSKARRLTAPAKSPPSPTNGTTSRPRGDPFAREWVPLPTVAKKIGFHWKTIRKYIAAEPFVRVLGPRWYVRVPEFLEWWERQRPAARAAAGRGTR